MLFLLHICKCSL